MAPHVSFQTKKSPQISVSNIRDIAFYRCSEIIRTRKFTTFAVHATIFGQFMAAFHFFNHTGEISHFTFDLLETFDYWQNLGLSKKSSKTWEVSIWSGPRLNIIAWKLELLEIFSEVIVASKCGPLAGVEKEAMS